MDSVGDHGDEEFIDPMSPGATPAGADCFSEPGTSSAFCRGMPPRHRSGGLEGLDLNSQATELLQMNSSQGLLPSSPVRGTGPSPSTGGRANRHDSGGDAAATVGKLFRSRRTAGSAGIGDAATTAGVSGGVTPAFGTAAAASGATPRATVIPNGAGSSGGTSLFPATGLEEDETTSLEDKDKGFDLEYSMNFSSSDDEDDSSDDEDETLKIALHQLNMMQQCSAIACLLAGMYYHDTFVKKSKKRKSKPSRYE